MANCLNCGTQLPAFSLGEASPLCPACLEAHRQAAGLQPQPQSQPQPRTAPWDELPRAATSAPAWFSATYFLIAVNTVIFLLMVFKGVSFYSPTSKQILDWGGEFGPATLSGQYWRLVTASFLHIGVAHLAINMWSLYVVVPPIERLFGKTITFAIYLLTGVGASLLSLFWNPMRISAGASGALFGFIGVIIAFFHFAHLNVRPELVSHIRSWAVRMALINLLFGMTISAINNMAHLGGLVTGLLVGTLLAFTFHSPVEGRFTRQMRVCVISAVTLAAVFSLLLRAKADVRELGLGEAALDRGDTRAAITHFEKCVAMKPDQALCHFDLAFLLFQTSQFDAAQREYERTLAIDRENHPAEFNLGLVYMRKGQPQKAVTLFRAAEPHLVLDADDYSEFGAALLQTGEPEAAEAMLKKAIARDPKYAPPHRMLSALYDQQGRKADSEREARIAEELGK